MFDVLTEIVNHVATAARRAARTVRRSPAPFAVAALVALLLVLR